jgi:hypothetical protein
MTVREVLAKLVACEWRELSLLLGETHRFCLAEFVAFAWRNLLLAIAEQS